MVCRRYFHSVAVSTTTLQLTLMGETLKENSYDAWRLFRDVLLKMPLDYFSQDLSPQVSCGACTIKGERHYMLHVQ